MVQVHLKMPVQRWFLGHFSEGSLRAGIAAPRPRSAAVAERQPNIPHSSGTAPGTTTARAAEASSAPIQRSAHDF